MAIQGGIVATHAKVSAVVFEQPGTMTLREVSLLEPEPGDCVVDVEWSGISTGTERLLWQGRMPHFPGLSYPLVPGYESVGRITRESPNHNLRAGQRVFVPGSRGFSDVAGLFGGASARLVVPADRLIAIGDELAEEATLLALAATAYHAIQRADTLPDLIVGHGVLGRLIARITVAMGKRDLVVWEKHAARRGGAVDYQVVDPASDSRADYRVICDVSGDTALLDQLISRLAPQGCVILAGFYDTPLGFNFAPAFMREITLRVAAEWQPEDLTRVIQLIERGRLSLAQLITHRARPGEADAAYRTAFEAPDCLKMILDWRSA
jgi:3-hydroxyethyl bacteriochlorophyllide a dehydrogenase